ncbi:hypothetical protein AMECASPLE_011433, partial [Ameca splendens]
ALLPHQLHILCSLLGPKLCSPTKSPNNREERASATWTGLHPNLEVNLLNNQLCVGYQVRIIQHEGSNLIITKHASLSMPKI